MPSPWEEQIFRLQEAPEQRGREPAVFKGRQLIKCLADMATLETVEQFVQQIGQISDQHKRRSLVIGPSGPGRLILRYNPDGILKPEDPNFEEAIAGVEYSHEFAMRRSRGVRWLSSGLWVYKKTEQYFVDPNTNAAWHQRSLEACNPISVPKLYQAVIPATDKQIRKATRDIMMADREDKMNSSVRRGFGGTRIEG